MATRWYPKGLRKLLDPARASAVTVKVMLVDSTFAYAAAAEFITASGAGADEISVANYTPGFGSASRKTASVTVTEDTGEERVKWQVADLTWTELGSGATVGAALLVAENTTDADSDLLAFCDGPDKATNGSDLTVDFDADGNLRFNV